MEMLFITKQVQILTLVMTQYNSKKAVYMTHNHPTVRQTTQNI